MTAHRPPRSWRSITTLLWLLMILILSGSLTSANAEPKDRRLRVKPDLSRILRTHRFAEDLYAKFNLRFNPDGTFKIVQFTDTQDDQDIDPRTVALIEAVLADQKPDLVVFTGDNIRSGPQTVADVKKAINNVVAPVDSKGIPWLVTFGNHDEDHTPVTGVDAQDMLEIYRSYRYNINRRSPDEITGTGNMHTLIYSSRDRFRPAFNIWALDSGRYAPDKIADQTIADDFLLGWNWMPDWDWIRADQVGWYVATSEKLERTHGKKIPSLTFFHIPLQEFRTMYENGERHGVVGERNEDECPGPFNSGLFSAMLARGDVKGVFVGHDHVNNYVGNYFGITLGYSANTGFGTYGLGGADNDRLRGARVFVVHEDNPTPFETYMVYARNYGIQ